MRLWREFLHRRAHHGRRDAHVDAPGEDQREEEPGGRFQPQTKQDDDARGLHQQEDSARTAQRHEEEQQQGGARAADREHREHVGQERPVASVDVAHHQRQHHDVGAGVEQRRDEVDGDDVAHQGRLPQRPQASKKIPAKRRCRALQGLRREFRGCRRGQSEETRLNEQHVGQPKHVELPRQLVGADAHQRGGEGRQRHRALNVQPRDAVHHRRPGRVACRLQQGHGDAEGDDRPVAEATDASGHGERRYARRQGQRDQQLAPIEPIGEHAAKQQHRQRWHFHQRPAGAELHRFDIEVEHQQPLHEVGLHGHRRQPSAGTGEIPGELRLGRQGRAWLGRNGVHGASAIALGRREVRILLRQPWAGTYCAWRQWLTSNCDIASFRDRFRLRIVFRSLSTTFGEKT